MKTFFKELFDYSHHFNQQLFEVIEHNPDKVSDKTILLFSHLLNAHQIWNNRIEPEQPIYGVWQLHPVQDLQAIDQRNYEKTLQILGKFDLEQVIHYANSKGTVFNNSVRDILFHAVNHSTYHRAQIATEFKQHGLEPLMTDFIMYKR